MRYTIFFDQINRTNLQVKADNEEQARRKAIKLYGKCFEVPTSFVQEGWIVESDGEDK